MLGRISVHHTAEHSSGLTGGRQRLLSVLVAAGAHGTSAERIAEELWGEKQPNPWRPALRMSVARLRKELPDGWDVVSELGGYRITTGEGWIDAWRLGELSSSSDVVLEETLTWVLAGEPFADIDLLNIVAANIEHLRLLQIAIAERFCLQVPESITTATCSTLTALLRQHPYNDQLARLVAECLAGAGRRSEAVSAVASFLELFEQEFEWTPHELAEFVASSGSDAEPGVPAELLEERTSREARERPSEMPRELRQLVDAPIFGRAKELAILLGSGGALVTGDSGSGKSRLLAALIESDDESDVTYVVGDERLELLLGPFAAAIPELRDELIGAAFDESKGARDDGSGERAAPSRAWRIILDHFERRGVLRPQRLVVDDAHLLDRVSLASLRLLVRSNSSATLTVTVSGRSDVEDPDWVDFVRDARRAGLEPVEMVGLDLTTLERLVYEHFPETTREARSGLAADALEASGGLPAVAIPLIAGADPATLALPEKLAAVSGLGRVTVCLSGSARDLAAAAAVLGRQFSIGSLISLAGVGEEEVFGCLDEMWVHGLIDETDDPDQVRFRHLLIQRAFMEAVPRYRRSQLHLMAAGLTEDPHELARHHSGAGSLISAEVAADSLLHSARLLAKNRRWRRVARQLERVEALVGDDMDESALILWAAALDQSGADGVEPRRTAYRRAVASHNWEAALGAAIAGLPEAELPEGDPERIEMLEGIRLDQLPAELRFDLVLHLARQHAVAGNRGVALLYADMSIELASDADEVGLSHVSRWTATRHLHPEPHEFPPDLLNQGSLSVRTRIAQMSAIGAAEAGKFAEAREGAARFDVLAAELVDPLRMWQSMVLRAMFVFDDGLLDEARSLADQAAEFAQLYGLQQGTFTWGGQLFHEHNSRGTTAELWPMFESYRPNMDRSSLASSAMLLCQVAAEAGEPRDELRSLVLDGLERSRSPSLVVLGMLAPLIRAYTPDLAPRVRTLLEPFADSSLVVGFGVANLGPTVRYLSQLAEDRDEEADLLRRAITISDRNGAVLWRVLNRLDLAALGPDDRGEISEQAAILAIGTDLEDIVAERQDRSR